MEYIQIPIPDFSFSEIAKRKALDIAQQNFYVNSFNNPYVGTNERIENDIQQEFLSLKTKERFVFVAELINKLLDVKIKHRTEFENWQSKNRLAVNAKSNFESTQGTIAELQYFLYSLLDDCGYDLNRDTFTENEAEVFDSKIDEILESVKIMKMGQEALGEELQDLKDELESIKSEKILGKKITLQRLKGVTFEYLLDKLKDESYDVIKTLLIALLAQQGLNVTEIIPKLLGGH
jgi:hypothetical protein